MKWLWIVLGGLVVLVALLWLVGSFLPREHRATCRATFRTTPEALFAVLVDVDAYPSWREGVKSVRRLEPLGGKTTFVEDSEHGEITYVVESSEAPLRLVTRIADDALAFGGTWTFELAPVADGTRLSITEDGFVKPALFRVLSRFVFGHHSTMEQYLTSLAQRVGESVTVERG